MSDESGERLVTSEAYERMRRIDRNPWQRFRHWLHARAHPELHAAHCLKCRRNG